MKRLESNALPVRAISALVPGPLRSGAHSRRVQDTVLRLQRQIGNRAVQRLLSSAAPGPVHPDFENAIKSALGSGASLNANIRRTMERSTGADLSGVRIHTGPQAHELNEAVGARAFTLGADIFFRDSEFHPDTPDGDHLLAHELTHVVQQNGGGERVSRSCHKCEEEQAQAKLVVGGPDDEYEREADAIASQAMRMKRLESSTREGKEDDEEKDDENVVSGSSAGPYIQRIPAAGRDFGTRAYKGFGIATHIPGFIKDFVTDGFDVDYTTGGVWVAGNTWESIWELYDAGNNKLDSSTKIPFGEYTIPADKLKSGVPSDGTNAKWSLWYRVLRSNVPGDNDAYPYDFTTFDVYSSDVRDPKVNLREEEGPTPIWQYNFTPAADGASVNYSVSASENRSTDSSQTTSVSGTIGGSKDSSFSFPYQGLTGSFSKNLNYSATASISSTKSISMSTNLANTFSFQQGDLRRGVTYRIMAVPIYNMLDGSVEMIPHRDGVISAGGSRIEGGIRILKAIAFKIVPDDGGLPGRDAGTEGKAGRSGTCSCQHRDVFKSGGKSCQDLRESGVCTGPYKGVGEDTASCQANARDSAPAACRGCLGHCVFRRG